MSSELQLTIFDVCADARPGKASIIQAAAKTKNNRSRFVFAEAVWIIVFWSSFLENRPRKPVPADGSRECNRLGKELCSFLPRFNPHGRTKTRYRHGASLVTAARSSRS
jgi:hypothetical protein